MTPLVMSMEKNNSDKEVTVVIPTLGGQKLADTISIVNQGTLAPKEIVVVLPKGGKEPPLKFDNVRLIFADKKGQVSQRLVGFNRVNTNLVVQLDDDIKLEPNSLKSMVDLLLDLGPGHAVAPLLYDYKSGQSLHKFELGMTGVLKSLSAFMLSSSLWGKNRMGTITPIGVAYGIDPHFYKHVDLVEVSWLPGGCVLGYNNDLITEDFFPFSGKAYSEDVIHSLLRTSKNIKHVICLKARADTEVDESTFSWSDFNTEFETKKYIARLLNGGRLRLFIWFFGQAVIRFFRASR